jgi:hypothetical protein
MEASNYRSTGRAMIVSANTTVNLVLPTPQGMASGFPVPVIEKPACALLNSHQRIDIAGHHQMPAPR